MAETNLNLKKTRTVAEKMPKVGKPQEGFFDFWGKNKITEKNNKRTLEARFRSDIMSRMNFWENTMYPFWFQAIKDYTLDTTERKLDLIKKKRAYLTNEKQPIVRTYVDRLHQSLFKTQFFIKAYPLSEKRAKKAKAVQRSLERCFASSGARKALNDLGKTALLQGPAFCRTSFIVPDEKIKDVKNGDKESLFHIEKFYANIERVSEFSLYGEPHVPFYEQRDMIYRKVLPMKTILKKLATLGVKISDEHIKYILDHPYAFSRRDHEKVRLSKYYSNLIVNPQNKDFNYENFYQLTLDNKHCEYVEYWTEDNLVLYINGFIVYDGENPLNKDPDRPKRVHPFKFCAFTREPGGWIADGLGPLLAGQQRLYDALYNMSFDLLKFAAGPMFLLQPGQSIEGNEQLLNYEPFTFKQVRGPGKIETLELPKPAPEVSKAMSDILEMANFMIAPAMYNQLQGVSRSATDSQFRFEGLKDSIVGLVTSMNEMLNVIAEEFLRDMKLYMPKKFKIPVFGNDSLVREWEEITTEDLEGDFIFEWDSESIRDINKVVERSQLAELTNFLNAYANDPISGKWMIDNEKLISEGLALFNKDPDILLTDKEYQAKMLQAQKQAMEMQSKLQAYQQELMNPNEGEQPMGGGVPQEQTPIGPMPTAPVVGSNLNTNVGGTEMAAAEPMNIASLLKQANE